MFTYHEASDDELLRRYLAGDDHSFTVIISRYRKQLLSAILFIVRDQFTAEDLLQDALIRINTSIIQNRYREEGRFYQWAQRIARNICLDHFRRAKRLPSFVEDTQVLVNFPSDEFFSKRHAPYFLDQRLEMLLEHLPADQRTVVHLRHYGELSFKDIAAKMDTSISTTMGRMRYGLLHLRKMIDRQPSLLE